MPNADNAENAGRRIRRKQGDLARDLGDEQRVARALAGPVRAIARGVELKDRSLARRAKELRDQLAQLEAESHLGWAGNRWDQLRLPRPLNPDGTPAALRIEEQTPEVADVLIEIVVAARRLVAGEQIFNLESICDLAGVTVEAYRCETTLSEAYVARAEDLAHHLTAFLNESDELTGALAEIIAPEELAEGASQACLVEEAAAHLYERLRPDTPAIKAVRATEMRVAAQAMVQKIEELVELWPQDLDALAGSLAEAASDIDLSGSELAYYYDHPAREAREDLESELTALARVRRLLTRTDAAGLRHLRNRREIELASGWTR